MEVEVTLVDDESEKNGDAVSAPIIGTTVKARRKVAEDRNLETNPTVSLERECCFPAFTL